MSANGSSAFSASFAFLKSCFISVISWLDGIKIVNGISLLDLNIAVVVFGILFTALFTVVRSGVDNSIGSVNRARREKARRENARNGKK